MLAYTSERGYHYQQARGGRIVRISQNNERAAESAHKPNVGDNVTVIVKPYNARKYVSGVVKRVLTRKQQHTRGFKVMLADGTVGRMVRAG